MAERPDVLIRTSSKYRAELSLNDNDDEALSMMQHRTQLNQMTKEARKRLKPTDGFAASYWDDRSLIIKYTSESLNLTYRLSEREHIKKGRGDRQEWRSSSEARELMEQLRATDLDISTSTIVALYSEDIGITTSTGNFLKTRL